MKIEAIQDARTRRIIRLDIEAVKFDEERALTFLFRALIEGREIAVELPDENEYVFHVEIT